MAEQDYVRLNTRLYPDRDEDLIEWFNALSYGEKSDAVKDVLRRGLDLTDDGRDDQTPASPEGTVAGFDREALAEIRRIVETAVESALQQYGIEAVEAMPPDGSPAADNGAGDEAEAILSMLDAGVTLD